jgi:hypothetical protein
MTRALIGASGTLASLTFVTREANTSTRIAIANTLRGTLSVLVMNTLNIRGINPGKFIRANALGTITRVMRQTQTPVIVTLTNTVSTASTVTGARVIATCRH